MLARPPTTCFGTSGGLLDCPNASSKLAANPASKFASKFVSNGAPGSPNGATGSSIGAAAASCSGSGSGSGTADGRTRSGFLAEGLLPATLVGFGAVAGFSGLGGDGGLAGLGGADFGLAAGSCAVGGVGGFSGASGSNFLSGSSCIGVAAVTMICAKLSWLLSPALAVAAGAAAGAAAAATDAVAPCRDSSSMVAASSACAKLILSGRIVIVQRHTVQLIVDLARGRYDRDLVRRLARVLHRILILVVHRVVHGRERNLARQLGRRVRIDRCVTLHVEIVVRHETFLAAVVACPQPPIPIALADHLELFALDYGQLVRVLGSVRVQRSTLERLARRFAWLCSGCRRFLGRSLTAGRGRCRLFRTPVDLDRIVPAVGNLFNLLPLLLYAKLCRMETP
uniref:Uncharacterized protein n=1 Tax=Anopheles coluzzii TaxID=1518534 RepID=A0A8W7PIH3_ANOCL